MQRIETHRKRNVPMIVILIGMITSIILIASSLFFLLYPFPSTEKIPYFTSKHPIIYNGEIEYEAFIKDQEIYFPLPFFQQYIDEGILMDKSSNSLIVTTKDKVLQLPSDSLTVFINEEPVELEIPATMVNDGEVYVSFKLLKDYYSFEAKLLESGAVLLQKDGDTIIHGKILSAKSEHTLRLRTEPDIRTPYTSEVIEGEEVVIQEEQESFYLIRKENGMEGYIPKKVVSISETETVVISRKQEPRFSPQVQWPINLTWEAVYTKNPDTSLLPTLTGVNVVSPTWFKIKNEQGEVANLGSMEYVDWAKANNHQIWGLFSNDFNPDLTVTALQTFETRQTMIRQLLHYSEMYKLNGINIDFENVYLKDGQLVTQFVKELTPYMHEAGLTVSMDITFISDSETWSKFYEREKLAEIVDYLIVMAYDEHWATSPISGSVASFPWVEANLKALLEVVPHDRLILGVPLYARIWKEQDTEGGNIEVSSKAYSMDKIKQWVTEHNLVPIFDQESGQFYTEYRDEEEKATYKVWIEDLDSLSRRSQLVHQYQLAGVATWSRYFASDDAWEAIDQSLKHRK
ncbi:glycosyl hydrolase family 18 protein [Bacillus sp. AK128]